MKRYSEDFLRTVVTNVFLACGSPQNEAAIVADHLVLSSLMGVDSHGVAMIPKYVQWAKQGTVKPGAPISIIDGKGGTIVVDCNRNFGQVGALKATEAVIRKARAHKISTVITRNCCHVSRLGHYTQKAAEAGMFALVLVNSPIHGHRVVPFGGSEGRIAPNPISYAAPGKDHPILADMCMSTIPFGKVVVHNNRGEPAPEGCIIDAAGKATTDTAVMFQDPPGWLLPLGGSAGHKGFALLLLAEILCGTLADTAMTDEIPDGINGFFLVVLDISAFLPLRRFRELLAEMTTYIKSSPTADGVEEVMLPGEIEFRVLEERKKRGIPIDPATWQQIKESADTLKVKIHDQ